MENFLAGTLIILALLFLLSEIASRWIRKPYKCSCGYKAPSKEEVLAHVLAKNEHKLIE